MLDLLRATEATEAISRAPFVADRLSRTLFYIWGQRCIWGQHPHELQFGELAFELADVHVVPFPDDFMAFGLKPFFEL